jgi:Uma2 family endonuclease
VRVKELQCRFGGGASTVSPWLPAEELALELEPDGTVVQKLSAQGQHSRLQLALCEQINGFAENRRLALAFPALRVVFGAAAYVPDVSSSDRTASPELSTARWPTSSGPRPT